MGGTVTAAYTYGSALLRRNTEVPLYDALGSERTVTDGSGAVTGSIAYEAFGQPVATSGSSASPYTFAATSGYRNDGDAGLTHVGARYYDAQVGRFVSRDTELDQHPYLYCDHDPVNALDPSGHNRITEWIGRTCGVDFNFNNDDWIQIENGIDHWGDVEIGLGGLPGVGGTIGWGNPSPRQNVPGLTPPKFMPVEGLPNTYEWILPDPAKTGGIVGAIGGGLVLGGAVAKGIAWLLHRYD